MLASREVMVCLARPESVLDPGRRAAARALLTDEERGQLERFRFDRDRDVALVSRVLQRRALSRCTDGAIEPDAWRFTPDPHGRPRVTAPAPSPSLVWNVANTVGLVACTVTLGEAVGIDVEARRADAPPEIVDTHFSPSERTALLDLPGPDRPRRFVELWTLKEAYLKARGLGLALPLERFSFDPSTTPPGFVIDPANADDPTHWLVAQWWPTPDHCVALCVHRAGPAPLAIAVHWDDLG